VIMAHHDTVVQAEDHVIVFVTDKKTAAHGEKLFEVSVDSVLNRSSARHGQAVTRSQRAERLDRRVRSPAMLLPLGRIGSCTAMPRDTPTLRGRADYLCERSDIWVLTRSSQAELQTR